MRGILPIAKTTHLLQTEKIEIIPKSKIWLMVGYGKALDDCGKFGFKGCLNVVKHGGLIDNPSVEGKAFVKRFKRSCDRSECPICFEKWAVKQAHRSKLRIKSYKAGYRKNIHVTCSIPKSDYDLFDDKEGYRKIRSKAYKLIKNAGFVGGNLVPHPFRKDASGWYYSPHFHAVGYGWIKNTKEIYEKTGYVVKNLRVRKSTSGTLYYQLNHAGVSLLKNGKIQYGYNTITWFGQLSYNKLEYTPPKDERETCPLCDEKLVLLVPSKESDRPPPEEEGEFYDDAKNWTYKIYDETKHDVWYMN